MQALLYMLDLLRVHASAQHKRRGCLDPAMSCHAVLDPMEVAAIYTKVDGLEHEKGLSLGLPST